MQARIEPPGPRLGSRGRPRDPRLEERVFDATLRVYAMVGWRGFTFDAVAKAAEVGKAAIYRRWQTREELLIAALRVSWFRLDHIEQGSIRGELRMLAQMCLETLIGPYGGVVLHLHADAQNSEEVRAFAAPYRAEMAKQGRAIVSRAIERGELSRSVDTGMIVDLIVGSVSNHVTTTPHRLRAVMLEKSGRYIDDLVDLILNGIARP